MGSASAPRPGHRQPITAAAARITVGVLHLVDRGRKVGGDADPVVLVPPGRTVVITHTERFALCSRSPTADCVVPSTRSPTTWLPTAKTGPSPGTGTQPIRVHKVRHWISLARFAFTADTRSWPTWPRGGHFGCSFSDAGMLTWLWVCQRSWVSTSRSEGPSTTSVMVSPSGPFRAPRSRPARPRPESSPGRRRTGPSVLLCARPPLPRLRDHPAADRHNRLDPPPQTADHLAVLVPILLAALQHGAVAAEPVFADHVEVLPLRLRRKARGDLLEQVGPGAVSARKSWRGPSHRRPCLTRRRDRAVRAFFNASD